MAPLDRISLLLQSCLMLLWRLPSTIWFSPSNTMNDYNAPLGSYLYFLQRKAMLYFWRTPAREREMLFLCSRLPRGSSVNRAAIRGLPRGLVLLLFLTLLLAALFLLAFSPKQGPKGQAHALWQSAMPTMYGMLHIPTMEAMLHQSSPLLVPAKEKTHHGTMSPHQYVPALSSSSLCPCTCIAYTYTHACTCT